MMTVYQKYFLTSWEILEFHNTFIIFTSKKREIYSYKTQYI